VQYLFATDGERFPDAKFRNPRCCWYYHSTMNTQPSRNPNIHAVKKKIELSLSQAALMPLLTVHECISIFLSIMLYPSSPPSFKSKIVFGYVVIHSHG